MESHGKIDDCMGLYYPLYIGNYHNLRTYNPRE